MALLSRGASQTPSTASTKNATTGNSPGCTERCGRVEGARVHAGVVQAVIRHIVRTSDHVFAPLRRGPERVETWRL